VKLFFRGVFPVAASIEYGYAIGASVVPWMSGRIACQLLQQALAVAP
jgi:hypothetical protein